MKRFSLLFTAFIMHNEIANAVAVSEQLKTISPKFIYSYIDFDFDSTPIGGNFNRYQGHSNTYTLGGDKVFDQYKAIAGIFVIATDTQVNSQFSIEPTVINRGSSNINNTTGFAHIRKTLKDPIDIDIAWGFGHSRVSAQTWVAPLINQSFFSHPNNDNWFVGLNIHYYKNWQRFSMKANIGTLYSEANTSPYLLHSTTVDIAAPKSKNNTTYVSENVEISYSHSEELKPFFNAGLIQVAGFNKTPNKVIVPVSGFLPQFNMNKDGFRLGAGFSYMRKSFTLRLEEKYYNAGGTFTSWQTIAALSYRFS